MELVKLKATSGGQMPIDPWDPPAPTPANGTAHAIAQPMPQCPTQAPPKLPSTPPIIPQPQKYRMLLLAQSLADHGKNLQPKDYISKAHTPLWHKPRYASLLFWCIASFKLFFQVIKHFINIFFCFKNIVCCSLLFNL